MDVGGGLGSKGGAGTTSDSEYGGGAAIRSETADLLLRCVISGFRKGFFERLCLRWSPGRSSLDFEAEFVLPMVYGERQKEGILCSANPLF